MSEVKNEGLEVVTRNFKTREGYDVWDKLCSIPKYGFLIGPSGGVAKVLGIGNWIDRDEAQSVVDVAQTELNEARAEALAGYAVRDARIVELEAVIGQRNGELTSTNRVMCSMALDIVAVGEALGISGEDQDGGTAEFVDAIGQLRAELAAIKAQEPVAWRNFDGEGGFDYTDDEETAERWKTYNGPKCADWVEPLYAAQVAKQVVMQGTNFTASNGEQRNPRYQGQFEGETLTQAADRLNWVTAAIESERLNAAKQGGQDE